MPYRYKDMWHRRSREFIQRKRASGKVRDYAESNYRMWLHQAWELLGKPNPANVTLAQLEELEGKWPVCENSKAVRLRVVKLFLTKCGNKAAQEWEVRAQSRPKEDRQFLSEDAVEDLRTVAHRLGPEHELIFSLGVDNSLRRGDIARIKLAEARELLWNGQAVITCKGRNGGKRRLLVMHKVTREPLREYLKVRQALVDRFGYDPGGLIIGQYRGKLRNYTPRTIANRDKEVGERAGIDLLSHDLRATFGNRHWKRGTDIAIIALLMGHESPDQTFKAYIGVSQGDMREAQDGLGARR